MADSGNNRVVVYDLDGNVLQMWGEKGRELGQFRMLPPNGLDVDDCGLVYVSDLTNRRVVVYTHDGKPLQSLQIDGQPKPKPRDVAVSGDTIALVGEGRVAVFKRSGVVCRE